MADFVYDSSLLIDKSISRLELSHRNLVADHNALKNQLNNTTPSVTTSSTRT